MRTVILVFLSALTFACTQETANMPPFDANGNYTPPYTSPAEPSPAPGAAPIPEKKQGWQQSGTLTTKDTVKAVTMQADFPRAGAYTVQFQVTPPTRDQAGNPFTGIFSAKATISWAVEGSTVRRIVDVGNGVSVSGVGQAVRVQINDTTNPAFALPSPADYIVAVQVAPGTRPSQNKPPTLQALVGATAVNHGNSLSVPIPKDAGVISAKLLLGPKSAGPFQITNAVIFVRDPVATILATWNYDDQSEFVPIPAGATELDISNQDAANDYWAQVLWGIDG